MSSFGLSKQLGIAIPEAKDYMDIYFNRYPKIKSYMNEMKAFAKTNAGVGLMIMSIGGFVAYIKHIGASSALVNLALKPLSLFKKKPQLLAVMVIPIGQLLFICIPSAAGLGLLLMASVFPILIKLIFWLVYIQRAPSTFWVKRKYMFD